MDVVTSANSKTAQAQNSEDKLKVLHIINDLDIGGAQEVVRTLVEYLALGNCVPIVCAFRDGPLRQAIEHLGIKVEILLPRRYSIIAFPLFVIDMMRICRMLSRLVKRYEIDVIQTHLLGSLDFLALLLRFTTRLRVIFWTFHSANFGLTRAHLNKNKWLFGPKRYVQNLMYRLTSSLVSGFIAVSDEVAGAIVESVGPIQHKVIVICNGVDVGRYGQAVNRASVRSQLGLEVDSPLIVVVGTLKEPKGHRYLVEAMSAIVCRYPDAHALFIGDGVLRSELQAQVETLNLEEHVHFLGNRDDVPELLAASDLFVLPSLWEGLSMALLEAMASSKPIVATAISGTTQVMIPGKTGLVVPPGDASILAEAVIQLLADPAQAQAMAQAARKHVENHYSAQKQADEYLALYRRLLTQAV